MVVAAVESERKRAGRDENEKSRKRCRRRPRVTTVRRVRAGRAEWAERDFRGGRMRDDTKAVCRTRVERDRPGAIGPGDGTLDFPGARQWFATNARRDLP